MKLYDNAQKNRSILILVLLSICYLIIILHLYTMQIKQEDFFKNLADKQYNISMSTMPPRALIFDRNGTPVALNKETFSAFVIPKQIINKPLIIDFLSKHFPLAVDRLTNSFDKNFFCIARKLTKEQQELITHANIPDIHLLQEPSRYYPYACLSTIIGITDIDNQGTIGLEKQYNQILQGTPTIHTLKKDARANHFYFEQEILEQGHSGKPIYLTIDADLQFKINKLVEDTVHQLQAKEAALVIINPQNGEIFAMASYPYFDPNNTQNLDMQTTKNRPATEAFESGSVIKTFCALAALDMQVVSLDELIDCQNTKETKIDGIRVRTTHPHGKISFQKIIEQSNNIGTVKVAKRINEKLYDYYKLLGFGQPTGLHFPGEHKGFVNPPEKWSAYSIISLSFGYEISTTLLQLARALSAVYNGGYLVQPNLILQKNNTKKFDSIGINEQAYKDLDTILQACVQQGSGKRAQIKGYTISGKTGTANILEQGKYNEEKHVNSFIGHVQKDDYQRVVCVYVKESATANYSSVITAPLFGKAVEILLLHDHIIAS